MDIYVDVPVYNDELMVTHNRFLFHTLSHGHDVYFSKPRRGLRSGTLYFVGPGNPFTSAVHTIVVVYEDHLWDNQTWLGDPEYIRNTIRYAVAAGLIPERFKHWVDKYE